MHKARIIFGSTTGTTESAAKQIAAKLGAEAVNIAEAAAGDFDAELLILGSSTWGIGELQDDWASGITMLDSIDLRGKKAAVFGAGDQDGFGSSFVDAIGILADKLKERGAEIVGETSAEGYTHSSSAAASGGKFCGLAIDDTNEAGKTGDRIAAWVEDLKKHL